MTILSGHAKFTNASVVGCSCPSAQIMKTKSQRSSHALAILPKNQCIDNYEGEVNLWVLTSANRHQANRILSNHNAKARLGRPIGPRYSASPTKVSF
jgi:hypothetical protein